MARSSHYGGAEVFGHPYGFMRGDTRSPHNRLGTVTLVHDPQPAGHHAHHHQRKIGSVSHHRAKGRLSTLINSAWVFEITDALLGLSSSIMAISPTIPPASTTS